MANNPRDTRTQIIDSAEAAFAANGYGGARVKDIAAKAGVTHAMVHYYFNSKEELHRAVLTRMIEDLVDLVSHIAPEPIDPIVKLRRFFEGFFDYAARHRNFARITAMETGHNNQQYFIDLIKNHFRPLYNDAKEFIRDGISAGIFRQVDPDHLLSAIYGMTMSYFSESPFLEVLTGHDLTADSAVDTRRDILMDMIFRALLVDPTQVDNL